MEREDSLTNSTLSLGAIHSPIATIVQRVAAWTNSDTDADCTASSVFTIGPTPVETMVSDKQEVLTLASF